MKKLNKQKSILAIHPIQKRTCHGRCAFYHHKKVAICGKVCYNEGDISFAVPKHMF